MSYLTTIVDRLAASDACGYQPRGHAATEPTALAAIALLAHGHHQAARRHVEQLLEMQNADGSLGVDWVQREPGWPTGWAIIAWAEAQQSPISSADYVLAFERACGWLIGIEGDGGDTVNWKGHDVDLRGWPWVVGTHSWVEPTAFNVMALKHVGLAKHRRTLQGTAVLVNRLLDDGGCNYGNTIVFGQALRPHIEPTGVTLMALAGEAHTDLRIQRSVEYLQRELSPQTATVSLYYGLLGLAAQGAFPAIADRMLSAAADRTLAQGGSPYKLALLALAALGRECPLIAHTESKIAAGSST
jgi:hypothetical protein